MSRFNGPKHALIIGAAWAVGLRWSIKLLGLVNTVIMARLLMPADYGIVAMAMLVVGLTHALLDMGSQTALLRKKEVTREEVDSVWTLRLMQGVAIGLVIVALAYPASLYFKEPRVTAVLFVLAACFVVGSASNIGMTLAQKELNYALEFRAAVIAKVLGVLVTIVTGYLLRDYRALVAGVATGYLAAALNSYLMHPYRPRWCTTKIRETWQLTKWLLAASVGSFLLRKTDELAAARLGNAQEFGLYNVGADLGQMPTGEVGPAIMRSFLPVISAIQDDAPRTNAAVVKTISAINTITMPIGALVMVLAVPITAVLLGPTWAAAAVYVTVFALISTTQIMWNPLGFLLVLRGHTRQHSRVIWLEFLAFAVTAPLLVMQFSLLGLALARVVGSFANAVGAMFYTRHLCRLSLRAVCAGTIRPVVGSALAAAAASSSASWGGNALLQLVIGSAVGTLVYAAWTFASWHLAGRPEGLESTIIDRIKK